ncbi:GTPase Era [Candidatus Caldatribacterium saccharofermentans]|uniref:GTPase Era n=1 Tax=Candidatus Caldatribacterium saccharofermentans TaxID=1454753 RepID=A0A7V4TG64_9BACT
MNFRAGFVTIWGRPNVGKSTFLNRVIGQKVSIVSDKPQTTRRVVKGIVNLDNAQIVFLDTPGLHTPKDRLGEIMMQEIEDTLLDVDLLCYMTDPAFQEEEERKYLEKLNGFSRPVFLVLNKKDLLEEGETESILERLGKHYAFAERLAISCTTGEGIRELLERIVAYLPENPPYYEPGIVSDAFERDIVAEIVREKVWWHVHQEVPYGVEVRVEEFKERDDLLYIRAIIYVERESHKKIVIGEGGRMIKRIGEDARRDIEAQWGRKVYLDLWVKVEKNWRKRDEVLRRFGYRVK